MLYFESWGIFLWLILLFIILPIILAIAYKPFRLFLGLLLVIVGILEVLAVGWLFGLGWFIGLPTIFIGVILIALGWPSEKVIIYTDKEKQQTKYCIHCRSKLPIEFATCPYCEKRQ